ncbi:MAG: DUF368 domain-containing protein [Flammeovirgaceae bacterium]|nr:DUF368 domain-containing protein [Flammeovirgaceae bacterium]|tara:strand:+ start:1735 stop:2574 length:840 start_codon:yes stop_codon:yes gene_type:complete
MSLNNRSILFLKGMAMGISDLIPGISGGTIALLLGIYKDFISSLKSINYKSFIYLIRLDFKKLNNQLNLCFLLPVFFGILSSIFIFSSLISFLLLDYKVLLFSFFFGLIFFSSIRLISDLKPTNTLDFLTVFVGLVIGLSFFFVSSLSTSNSIFSIFLAGFIAISAMLLPGISGSYILLILGKYEFMLDSISSFNWINILIFSLGAITGILSFSKMIHYLLKNYYRSTIFFLSGLMMGALNKVWPWQLDNKIVLPEGDILMPFIVFIISGIISYNLKSE